jgi:hypothetical protein
MEIPGSSARIVMVQVRRQTMKRTVISRQCRIGLIAIGLFFAGCNTAKQPEPGLSVSDARAIAKDAYIYDFPMVVNYHTTYKQALNTSSLDYRGSFNVENSSKSVATPADKFVVTPNSDTPTPAQDQGHRRTARQDAAGVGWYI